MTRPCDTCSVSIEICRESGYGERCCHACSHAPANVFTEVDQ